MIQSNGRIFELSPMAEQQTLGSADSGGGDSGGLRAEIDTSAPFDSVKEAVSRFGGLGFWKPYHQNVKPSHSLQPCDVEEVDVAKVEEQAAELEKELILKERETLEVLKELEATKMIVEKLKLKLQKEESTTQLDVNVHLADQKPSILNEEEEEEKENNPYLSLQKLPSSTPGVILMELKQTKLNLTRTTSDLVEIRASLETYNKKVERERISLEKTRERLQSNSSMITSLEEEINLTRSKLEEADDDSGDGGDIMAELQRLTAEAEEFMLEIEETKAQVRTAEIRLVAAMKMKEAARAAEAFALEEIKALEKSENSSDEKITLTLEEYSSLKHKAQDAEESSKVKVINAMLQVDGANVSETDITKRVEEAMEELGTCKQALEEDLNRVEAANRAKLAVEEVLRKWRSEHGERRRSIIQNSTKFKNPYPSLRRRDTPMLDLNGIDLVTDSTAPVLKPTLSIGQILSNKLLIAEEFKLGKGYVKRKVSLGQMLGKQNVDSGGSKSKKLPSKRKKFGFARFSVLLTEQSKKKKSASSAR